MADGYFLIDGGLVQIVGNTTYPTTATGLPPGAVWNNGGLVAIVAGGTPSGQIIEFPGVTPSAMLASGAAGIPDVPGVAGTLWNCGGLLAVSFAPQIWQLLWTQTPQSLQKTINSYLYIQYNDDENLQAFIDAYNQLTQQYVDWFNQIALPIYTNPQISGLLLDWVATGLYGQARPVFSVGTQSWTGSIGTFTPGARPPLAGVIVSSSSSYYQADDDIYKRVLTWNFYKGDGRTFSIPWLKRRIARFILGINGTAPNVDFTPGISVTPATALQYVNGTSYLIGPLGTATPGSLPLASVVTETIPEYYLPISNTIAVTLSISILGPSANVLASALLCGAVQMPFQFKFTVTVV